jgi:hypothetical protein
MWNLDSCETKIPAVYYQIIRLHFYSLVKFMFRNLHLRHIYKHWYQNWLDEIFDDYVNARIRMESSLAFCKLFLNSFRFFNTQYQFIELSSAAYYFCIYFWYSIKFIAMDLLKMFSSCRSITSSILLTALKILLIGWFAVFIIAPLIFKFSYSIQRGILFLTFSKYFYWFFKKYFIKK